MPSLDVKQLGKSSTSDTVWGLILFVGIIAAIYWLANSAYEHYFRFNLTESQCKWEQNDEAPNGKEVCRQIFKNGKHIFKVKCGDSSFSACSQLVVGTAYDFKVSSIAHSLYDPSNDKIHLVIESESLDSGVF